jgi:hypothetical protein
MCSCCATERRAGDSQAGKGSGSAKGEKGVKGVKGGAMRETPRKRLDSPAQFRTTRASAQVELRESHSPQTVSVKGVMTQLALQAGQEKDPKLARNDLRSAAACGWNSQARDAILASREEQVAGLHNGSERP